MSTRIISKTSGRTIILPDGYEPDRNGPCPHLGAVLREEECRSCRGHVRKKVYACALRGEISLIDCRRCEHG